MLTRPIELLREIGLKNLGRACLYIYACLYLYWVLEKRIALRSFRRLRRRASDSSLPHCRGCPEFIRVKPVPSCDPRRSLLKATEPDFKYYTKDRLARARIEAVLGLMGTHSPVIFRLLSTFTIVVLILIIAAGNLVAYYAISPHPKFASIFSGFHQAFVVPYGNTLQVEWDVEYNSMAQDHAFIITAYTPGLRAENYGGIVIDVVPRWPTWANWSKFLFFAMEFNDKDWSNYDAILLSAKAEGCNVLRITLRDDSGGQLDDFVPLSTSFQTLRVPLRKTGYCDLSRIEAVHLHLDGTCFSDNNCRITIRSFKAQ